MFYIPLRMTNICLIYVFLFRNILDQVFYFNLKVKNLKLTKINRNGIKIDQVCSGTGSCICSEQPGQLWEGAGCGGSPQFWKQWSLVVETRRESLQQSSCRECQVAQGKLRAGWIHIWRLDIFNLLDILVYVYLTSSSSSFFFSS